MSDRRRLLELALKGLEAERTQIDGEIAQIKRELNPRSGPDKGSDSAHTMTSTPKKKRTMSAAARKKISEAMKRRYAEKAKAAKKAA